MLCNGILAKTSWNLRPCCRLQGVCKFIQRTVNRIWEHNYTRYHIHCSGWKVSILPACFSLSTIIFSGGIKGLCRGKQCNTKISDFPILVPPWNIWTLWNKNNWTHRHSLKYFIPLQFSLLKLSLFLNKVVIALNTAGKAIQTW